MLKIGYKLSSEEHRPQDLIAQARRAEQCGFSFAMISDHFHPWIDAQGQSPFVWPVIGAIAQATSKLLLGTAVTCPTIRLHPGIIAQAAATAASMMPGRFILGLGAGENLNEHIFGDRWPPVRIRHAMLKEAVGIIRLLWGGKQENFSGEYYQVENARLYTLPDELPPIALAASGPIAAKLAAEIGDSFVGTTADAEVIDVFNRSGGSGKPRYGELAVCWAENQNQAEETAYKVWPISGLSGPLMSELALPNYFEQAATMIGKAAVAKTVICGPDPERHWEAIQEYERAGYDHVFVHQVGADQEGFFQFYERKILPRL
ncbi:MAG: Luciferase-like monooxygenase [Deltaproteobacteria bacterium]|jgi:coenzyme F420-dependent glucose-6-phosphate dehydrogenase|nr:Luciferase-like monooxygenase [Deltaproteobacteria bacterium]